MRFARIAATVIAIFVSVSAMAADYKIDSLEIIGPWSRVTPKGASTAIGYMTIKNNGTTPDRLIGGSVDFASGFQLHSMTMEGGVSKMRELKSIDIGPGQTIEFKPGGSHVMFVGVSIRSAKASTSKGHSFSSTRVRCRSNTTCKGSALKAGHTIWTICSFLPQCEVTLLAHSVISRQRSKRSLSDT